MWLKAYSLSFSITCSVVATQVPEAITNLASVEVFSRLEVFSTELFAKANVPASIKASAKNTFFTLVYLIAIQL